MLTRSEFESGWFELNERFKMPQGKFIQLVYEAVKKLDKKQWNGLVERIIGDAKTHPTISEIKIMVSGIAVKQEVVHECFSCDSTGIKTYRFEGFYDVTCRCHCANGNQYPSLPSRVPKHEIESVKDAYRAYLESEHNLLVKKVEQ